MTAVKAGDTVRIHYTGTLDDGSTFDSSHGREPLQFTVGSGEIIPGLDAALPGMAVGEAKTVAIAAADAYGPKNPEAVAPVPRADIPDHIPLDPGTALQVQDGSGRVAQARVAEVTEDTVTLDMNHPLAGEDLTFDIELLEVV